MNVCVLLRLLRLVVVGMAKAHLQRHALWLQIYACAKFSSGVGRTEVLTPRTKPGGRGSYMKDRGLIFSRHNQTTRLIRALLYRIFGQHASSVTKGERHDLLNRAQLKKNSNNNQ